MTLRDALLEACDVLRDGGTIEARGLYELQRQLQERHEQFEQQLASAALPTGFEALQELLQQSFEEFQAALDALRIGFEEDAPELAAWVQNQTHDAEETLRQVRQSLEDYSAMLCEEGD